LAWKKGGRQENLKKWIHIHRDHIEEDFEEKIIKTNTLLGQDFDISQRIGEKPIIQLIESFTNLKMKVFIISSKDWEEENLISIKM
jgi:hypothetical protein